MLVLAVIAQRTVSLVWLAQHPLSNAKSSSVLRRFERFFAQVVLKPKQIATLMLALATKPAQGWVLAMDRTNWKFGKTHINILVVSVMVGKVGLPIAWKMLPKYIKRGNSRTNHRIKLIKQVLCILPAQHIAVLTMDREFIGKDWLGWLHKMKVPYIVRIKSNTRVGDHNALWLSKRKRWKYNSNKLHEIFGQQVYFAAKAINKGQGSYLMVISNIFHAEQALEFYRERWGIETLFSHLKKRGYQFEDTHMSKPERIEKLMAVLAVAFAMSYRWGQLLDQSGTKKLKKHGYRAKSLFRLGLESLHRMFKMPTLFPHQINDFFHLLFKPPLLQNFVG